MSWQQVSARSLPRDLQAGVSRLVQAVYQQRGQNLKSHSLDDYWTMVNISYQPEMPPSIYVQIAEGWSHSPGASMVCRLTDDGASRAVVGRSS